MLKKYLPLLGFTAAAYAVVYYLQNKAAAGTNLQYLPLDVAIDSQRTAQAGYSRIYYRLKLRLINDEPASVNVRSINLNITVGGNLIGKINNTTGFAVEANSTKDIQLDASFQTVNIISLIQDLIINGFEDPINVTGFIQTDLGRINIQFSKNLSGGISAPFKYNLGPYIYYGAYPNKSNLLNDAKKLDLQKSDFKIVTNETPLKRTIKQILKREKPKTVKQFLWYVKQNRAN